PTAPTNLTATAVGPGSIGLSWTAATELGGPTLTYIIEGCVGAGCTNFGQATTSTSTSATVGALGSTTYVFRVRAQDPSGSTGAYSNTATATTPPATPTAPGNLVLAPVSANEVDASWTPAGDVGGLISAY